MLYVYIGRQSVIPAWPPAAAEGTKRELKKSGCRYTDAVFGAVALIGLCVRQSNIR